MRSQAQFRSLSAVIRSRMTPSESLRVGMTQYRTSHESGVTSLQSCCYCRVTGSISHESRSRKETVRVTSRFHDNAALGGGCLDLHSLDSTRIGRIQKSLRHLYRVAHSHDSAHAVELLTVMELHCHLGHISAASARRLVETGAVTGIELDPNSSETNCETCLFARATRQPIKRACISSTAQHFGNEVHTDVWGPASVLTQGGRKYFVTFTDNVTRFTVSFVTVPRDHGSK
jgi:hypothetical protein